MKAVRGEVDRVKLESGVLDREWNMSEVNVCTSKCVNVS